MPITLDAAARPIIVSDTTTTTPNTTAPVAAPADAFGTAPAGSLTAPATPTAGGLSAIDVRTWNPPKKMPTSAGLGVNTIHRFTEPRVTPSVIAVTIYTPVPTAEVPGTMRNTNDKPFAEPLPRRWIIDDGGLTRAFTGIDLSKGSALDQKLDAIVSRIPKQPDGSIKHEDAIDFVKRETNRLIKWTAGSSANDGRDEFAWDRAIRVDKAHVQNVFSSAAYQNVGEPPIDTGQTMAIAPLEAYLDAGEGYCIQKALLAACILDKAGVPFRIINGAVAGAPGRSTGHTWLELEDGRILDPAWSSLQAVTFDHATHATWFRFGGSYRYASQSFPFMELP